MYRAIWSLAERELVRFFRQRSRLIGALVQPIMFWVLFGAGLHGSFQAPDWAPPGMTYQQYFLPGVVAMIVMFTAIFSTISIIEDRKEGFLQGVLIAPVPPVAIALGKVFGGTLLALIQATLFLLIAQLAGFSVPLLSWPILLGCLFLVGIQLTSLGVIMAWKMESTQGFHALMSVGLMPMWLLSGSFFPGDDSIWISWVIRLNPLTYGVAAIRRALNWGDPVPFSSEAGSTLPCWPLSLGVTFGVTLLYLGLAAWLVSKRHLRNAR